MKTFPEIVERWMGGRPLAVAGSALSVSPSTIHYWIRGEQLPPATRLPALAAAFGMKVDDLLQVIASDRKRMNRARSHASKCEVGRR